MNLIRSVAAAAVAALAAGCASMAGVAPQATPRDAARIDAARTLADTQLSAASWPSADWWAAYADPQLDALMSEALAQSPTLAVAAARTRKAIAATAAAQANRGPRVDATLSSTRERFSKNSIYPPPLGGSTQTVSSLQATLDWAVDFWGRDREAYEAALGAGRAAEVDAYAARLALSTGVALAYAELQHAYLQRDVAEAMLHEHEATLALTRDRVATGLDSRIEQKQAEAALPATRERIAALDERIQLARNALAALLGAGPDRGLAIARPTASALAPVALPSRVPAELLGRRPDIVAQRWRIEAARHAIASAKAQFYPNVNLVAFVGLEALGGAHLLNAASAMLGAGPAVSLPIFDAGRLRANLASTGADYDIAVGQYNQLLADAMRDVVDQIASLQSVAAQRKEQQQALATAREALDLALLRYREGLGNYRQVLSAEQPLFAEQEREADLRARELTLSIQLVRALGGGFDPAGTAPAALAARGTP
jgi:NodT family efflux transporter outer membrane factor (OMF) lipoprotein